MKGLLKLAAIAAVVLVVLAFTFGRVVPPGSIGVRQIAFGPTKGFHAVGLRAGYHWNLPVYSTIHLIPRTVQILDMQNEAESGSTHYSTLEIQTTDGARVHVDFSILFRLLSEPSKDPKAPHGGPADLITRLALNPQAWVDQVYTVAADELRKTLGLLSTSEFYNPEKREDQLSSAEEGMNARLLPLGMKIEGVMMRRFTYVEERIDQAIFQKNLQVVEARLNEAQGRLADAKASLEQVSAEWDAKIKTQRVEGENQARVLVSEGDLYETSQKASGDLAVAKARAEVDRLKANALASTAAASVYVGRELAPILGMLKGGVVADVDPFDLEGWIKRLGVVKR